MPLSSGDRAPDFDLPTEDGRVSLQGLKGKTVVAKVPAKVVDLNSPAANTAVVVTTNSDGSRSLTGARFEGKKFALEIGESSDGMQAGSAK